MPIAFTSPLFGALMGILFAGEPLTWKTVLGILLSVGGIVVLTLGGYTTPFVPTEKAGISRCRPFVHLKTARSQASDPLRAVVCHWRRRRPKPTKMIPNTIP